MIRKIVFGVLALVMVALPSVAQYGGNLSSFSDRSGDRVQYISNQNSYGGDIHAFWLNGTQPVDTDATTWYSAMGSEWALFGSLTSFSDGNGQHSFYIGGPDFHIHQLYWSWSTSSGSDLDWTKLAGAPMAFSNNGLTGFSNSRGQHAYYTEWPWNGHIHHLYAVGAAKPIDEDLTVKAGPGPTCANPNGALTSFSDGSTELVYYIGPSGHICELAGWPQTSWVWNSWLRRWVQVTVWKESSFDLTALSGGTPAMLFSPLTGYSDANGQNVFYLDPNHHIYQLHLSRSGTWSNPDLTAQFGGGNPAQAASLTAFSVCAAQVAAACAWEELVSYLDNSNNVNLITIPLGLHQVIYPALWDAGAMPMNTGACQFGTSLASISSDVSGGADVYYIGSDQHVYKIHAYPGELDFRYFVYPWADQTITYNGVAAGQQGSPLGWCLIG